jgi:fructose-1,6-bisphosphatase I
MKVKIFIIGNSGTWNKGMKAYVESKRTEGATLRYVGSMVADLHRTLLYGGVFLYP